MEYSVLISMKFDPNSVSGQTIPNFRPNSWFRIAIRAFFFAKFRTLKVFSIIFVGRQNIASERTWMTQFFLYISFKSTKRNQFTAKMCSKILQCVMGFQEFSLIFQNKLRNFAFILPNWIVNNIIAQALK